MDHFSTLHFIKIQNEQMESTPQDPIYQTSAPPHLQPKPPTLDSFHPTIPFQSFCPVLVIIAQAGALSIIEFYFIDNEQKLSRITALFTQSLDCLPSAGTVFRDCSPIHGLREFFHSTGIVPGKAQNSSASGLVTVLFTKPPAGPFLALPGTIPENP